PAIRQHGGEGCFDLVLLDPPYRQGLVASTVRTLAQARLLRPGAVIAAEQEAETEPVAITPWQVLQNRCYGDTRILVWQTP
ncbi:MAG: RsmD family RNA methyltransferase, partial [Magnetococcus sp. DMHC-8]